MKSLKDFILEAKKDIYYIIDYKQVSKVNSIEELIEEIKPIHILKSNDFENGSLKEDLGFDFIYDYSNYFKDNSKDGNKPKPEDLVFKLNEQFIFYRPNLNQIAGLPEEDDQIFVGTKEEIINNMIENKDEFDCDVEKLLK